MSDTHTETIPRAEPLEEVVSRARSWARWLKWTLLGLLLLWVAGFAIRLGIEHSSLQRKLTARLEAAFGRPVEVGGYDFSFWGGPVLEARSVTVGEDPRFGREYFLRAESMAVRLRWQSLLRGRIELGTLSLTRPSLNLVRNAAGDWNLAEWLPRPAESSSAPSGALRFRRIAVDAGRINFKRGDDKLPVAFVDVNGAVETDSPGRWRIDLDATPWRPAVVLQQVGTLHVSGHVGGTSSRLRPAALDVSWTDASLSDVLRLARGDDSGVRGELALSMTARTPDGEDTWNVQAHAALQQIHRWDLALRPDNPSVNLIVQMNWNPADPYVDLPAVALESPRSNARASGRILWDRDGAVKDGGKSSPVQVAVSSSQIDIGDLLAWLRAFHSGIADGVSLRGFAAVRGELSGWPPDLVSASLSTDGIDLVGASLRKPAHLGPFQFHYNKTGVSLTPVTLAWGPRPSAPDGSFRIDLSARPLPGALPAWHLAGSSAQMRDLIAAAGAFGWNISRGWSLSGPFACDLRWPAAPYPWRVQPVGWVDFGAAGDGHGASLKAPFLNQPVEQIKAHVALQPGDVRHIELSSAAAFGARWNGAFDRRGPSAEWQFALSVDSLDAADLDRWLNPVWRENFFESMLPFLGSRSSQNAVPENLRAAGRLSLAEFNLGPFVVSGLKGSLKVEGRHIGLANASGEFFGGAVAGSLDADLQSVPSYRASLDFSDVDVSALSAASPQLAGLFAGSASGHASFHALGANRSDLLASLECAGAASVTNAGLRNVNLADSLREAARVPGTTPFRRTSGEFVCLRRQIQIQDLRLLGANDEIDVSGSLDFSRNLDLRLRLLPSAAAEPAAVSLPQTPVVVYRLTGPLAAPQVAQVPAPPRRGR